jgi:hypothetical protein
MISCSEIRKALSSFENEQQIVIENFNPLFEQSVDFAKKYLQLVEDKIVENKWVDPNLSPEEFKQQKQNEKQSTSESHNESHNDSHNDSTNDSHNNSTNNSTKDSTKDTDIIYLNYKEHQTIDLPKSLSSLISENRRNELYYYGMKAPDSFLASILLSAEPNYWLQHRKKKREYADQLKTTFSIQKYDILRDLPKTSIGNDYISVIYKTTTDFPEHIDSDKSKEFQFLIGYHFKINILIIDFKNLTGSFATDWNEDLKSVILINDNNTYLPILSNKISYFNKDEIKELEKGFNILYPSKIIVQNKESEQVKRRGRTKKETTTSTTTTDTTNLNPNDNKNDTKNDNKNDNEIDIKSIEEHLLSKSKSSKSEIKMVSKVDDIDLKTIKVENMYALTKYQAVDLQSFAEKMKIPLENEKKMPNSTTVKIIKKLKKELYDDIIEKIKSFGNL